MTRLGYGNIGYGNIRIFSVIFHFFIFFTKHVLISYWRSYIRVCTLSQTLIASLV